MDGAILLPCGNDLISTFLSHSMTSYYSGWSICAHSWYICNSNSAVMNATGYKSTSNLQTYPYMSVLVSLYSYMCVYTHFLSHIHSEV